jgi:hypothetical protein
VCCWAGRMCTNCTVCPCLSSAGAAPLSVALRRRRNRPRDAAAGAGVAVQRVQPRYAAIRSLSAASVGFKPLTRVRPAAGDPTTTALLQRTRVHLVPSLNPDGHAQGSVTNGGGYDLNRNFHDRFDRAEEPGWPVRVGDTSRGETDEGVPSYHILRPEPEVPPACATPLC